MSDRRKILKAIKREGQKIRDPHARRVYLRAAVQTGLVESNLSNPQGGDADSAGWRQERASLYANPTNIKASARRFRQEFEQKYQPGEKSYDVAAQVQRPAAQYRGRYKDAAPQAAQILRGVKGTAPNTRQGSSSETTTTSYRSTPGTDYSTERRDAKLAYLQDSHNPDALLNLGLTLKGLKDTPGTSSKVVKRSSSSSSPGASRTGSALVDAVKSEADQINKAHVSYQWGGGHGAKQARGSKITPLDCSGAVSRVLGVNPRVSGEFAKWGKPGRGHRLTVYSNKEHVLLEVNGHFWGTSASNPGGGPGWIPRKQIPPSYLARFTARHM